METLQTKTNSPDPSNTIHKVLEASGLDCTQDQLQQIKRYFQELYTWNKTINLTGLKDLETMILKHLGDTVLFYTYIPQCLGDKRKVMTLLDVGTGAGIPGVLVKILSPDLTVVLAEVVKKKCSFLHYVISTLGLKDIYLEEARIDKEHPPRHLPGEGFDIVVSQAAVKVEWLVENTLAFLSDEGCIVALKGPSALETLEDTRRFVEGRGLTMRSIMAPLPVLAHKRVILEVKRSS